MKRQLQHEGQGAQEVPDLWTLSDTGSTLADLEVLGEAQLKRHPSGEQLLPTVPPPSPHGGSRRLARWIPCVAGIAIAGGSLVAAPSAYADICRFLDAHRR